MTPKPSTQPAALVQDTVIPRHLGIILDGNRRWAKQNGLPSFEGHRHGYDNLKKIADAAFERGVKYLTAFVFSTENWQRSKEEVNYLMKLLYWVATHEAEEMHKKNIRVRMLGEKKGLLPKIVKAIEAAEKKTAQNSGGTLGLCLNYGGTVEIASAASRLIKEGVAPDKVTPEKFEQYLYAPDIPPIDLLIRTSGEQRLSGFMLYRAAYAELLFVSKHWPDFSVADLDAALADYAGRARRFGR